MTGPGSMSLLLFLAFFAGFWLLVCALLSELSRWPRLADRFPAGERPSGPVLRGQVVGIGIVNERNVTGLIVTPVGLYMYVNVLFRFRRPPLLIPWPEIQYVSGRRFLWMEYHRLNLGGDITSIRIKGRALRELQPFLPIQATHPAQGEAALPGGASAWR